MQGMLTEQKQTKSGERLRRRTLLSVGKERLLIRYRRPKQAALPRSLRSCEPILYPFGHPENRIWALRMFRFFLPRVLKKLERIYFPEHSVCVAVVSPQLSSDVRQAFLLTLPIAGNCIICTEDVSGEEWTAELMDEYGLTAIAAPQHTLLRQADLVLAFSDPNEWIRRCKQDAVVLNLSETPMNVHYGRIVIDGVEVKPIPRLFEQLPSDGDWTAFCGCFLPELEEVLQLKQPLYAKGTNKG